ncbi:hypothetical protein NDU88_000803 [Pleurodeles waltl]|uniref:Uncharacterized protein n=1 Tax=Pleurodeles waltl TaxID=8319 RepID=A0AAV7Q3V5_PLEWA|nr:hypothetical protein NDU88_000803 [Pleurodeles waltl]
MQPHPAGASVEKRRLVLEIAPWQAWPQTTCVTASSKVPARGGNGLQGDSRSNTAKSDPLLGTRAARERERDARFSQWHQKETEEAYRLVQGHNNKIKNREKENTTHKKA